MIIHYTWKVNLLTTSQGTDIRNFPKMSLNV